MLFTVRLKDNKEFVRLYGKGAFVSCGMWLRYCDNRKAGQHRVQVLSHQHIFQKKGHSCHERPSEAEEDC